MFVLFHLCLFTWFNTPQNDQRVLMGDFILNFFCTNHEIDEIRKPIPASVGWITVGFSCDEEA